MPAAYNRAFKPQFYLQVSQALVNLSLGRGQQPSATVTGFWFTNVKLQQHLLIRPYGNVTQTHTNNGNHGANVSDILLSWEIWYWTIYVGWSKTSKSKRICSVWSYFSFYISQNCGYHASFIAPEKNCCCSLSTALLNTLFVTQNNC